MPTAELITLLDATLPQTQCGLCGHPAGCLPYATAMANGAPADGCVPGGQPVANQLASILKREPIAVQASQWPISEDGRPQRMKAVIREDECIGCTKCITACPVDAIIGSGKMMHSILTDLCTGCELCIPPCPVDCIDLVVDHQPVPHDLQRIKEQNDLRQRYQRHVIREQQHLLLKKTTKPIVSRILSQAEATAITGVEIKTLTTLTDQVLTIAPKPTATTTIQLASLRSQIKKLQKQLAVHTDEAKQAELERLQATLKELMG